MSKNKISGDEGEQEIIDLVPCPNCKKKLMLLPENYPLYDLQCTEMWSDPMFSDLHYQESQMA